MSDANLLEKVILVCVWISICDGDDEIVLSTTVKEFNCKTCTDTRGKEMFDVSDLFVLI